MSNDESGRWGSGGIVFHACLALLLVFGGLIAASLFTGCHSEDRDWARTPNGYVYENRSSIPSDTVAGWIDYRVDQWVAGRPEYDANYLYAIARDQKIVVVDAHDSDCNCGGWHFWGSIGVSVYPLDGQGMGIQALPHELDHAIGIGH